MLVALRDRGVSIESVTVQKPSLDEVFLAVPGSVKRYAELHPRDDQDVVEGAAKVIGALVAAHEGAVVPA